MMKWMSSSFNFAKMKFLGSNIVPPPGDFSFTWRKKGKCFLFFSQIVEHHKE